MTADRTEDFAAYTDAELMAVFAAMSFMKTPERNRK